MSSEVLVVRIRIQEDLKATQDVVESHFVDARCLQTNALTGDPATIVLIVLVGLETVSEIRKLISVFLGRKRSVDITMGDTKISVAHPRDLDTVATFLEERAPEVVPSVHDRQSSMPQSRPRRMLEINDQLQD